MRTAHVLGAISVLLLPCCVGSLEVKWTPADEEGPMPLSKRYRDKLDLLEAKVQPRAL